MASLKAHLFSSASANAGLQALLQNGPVFQWGDVQLSQQWDLTNHSAVLMFLVSNPKDYISTGVMFTGWVRVQFSIYGHGNDSENADAVAEALFAWVLTLVALTPDGQPSNFVEGDRDFGIAQTQPLTYQRIIDVSMYVDNSVL